MADDPIVALRELLSQPPSRARFGAILELFEQWVEPETQEFALEYASTHLEPWGDEHRHTSAQRVWPTCPEGEPLYAFSLIRSLDLSRCRLGPPGAVELASSEHLQMLAALVLFHNQIGDAGAKALAQSPYIGRLRMLYLDGNEIGDDGAEALAASPSFEGLEVLYLFNNRIGDAGAKALASSPHLRRLQALYLGNNRFGLEGLRALSFSPHLGESIRREFFDQMHFSDVLARAREEGIEGCELMDTYELYQALME